MNLIFKILGMIANERNKSLVISFGLGLTSLSCEVGQDIPVYVDGVYNQNEYQLNQNEVDDIITMVYKDGLGGTLTEDFILDGTYNGRNVYKGDIGAVGFSYLVWNNNRWNVSNNFIPNLNVVGSVVAILPLNIIRPIGIKQWLGFDDNGGAFANGLVIKTTSNITTGGFTFPAVVSKQIQCEMQRKDGSIVKSNKINLIVN